MKNSKSKQKECQRVPIVSILGHVDHGKTTILDRIREANVQECEAGGITQKISVFTVTPDCKSDNRITFVDTPGHEAFDLMRLRGGNIADVVLLIVAANDGVKPQTKESIEIILNSNAKPIVVLNKCDLPGIDKEKIKRDIANEGLLVEGMGGSVPVISVSAKTGDGIKDLLDMINLVIEVEGFSDRGKLAPGVKAQGYVLESVKEKSRGNVSTVVITQGCFDKGDLVGYTVGKEKYIEKLKGVVSEEGSNIEMLETGCGGRIIGLSNLLELGSEVYILEKNDKKILNCALGDEEACELVETDNDIDDFFSESVQEEEDVKILSVIIKSSSEGSLEALTKSVESIEVEGCRVNIVEKGVGDISMKDIDKAEITKAIVLGFEVGMEKGVEDIAKKNRVLVRLYDIIYKVTDEIQGALEMLSTPQEVEEEIGKAQVKAIFELTDGSKVIGNRVMSGIMKRDSKCYVVRNDEIIGEAHIKSLRINKDTVNQASKGMECGVILDKDVDAQVGDELYCYKIVK